MSSKEKADTAQTVKDSQEPLIGQEEEEVVLSDETISFGTALKESSKLAILQVMGTMFHPIYSIVNNVVLGHANDPVLLAGLGLGALTVGITGLSLGICFAFGAGTFMSQEFGAENHRNIQVYLYRSIFLNTCAWLILFIPSLFIDSFYRAIGQDEDIAAYGARYVHTVMPFMLLELINWSYLQFCTSQKVLTVMVISIATGALTHGALIGILYFGLDWGFTGVCIATASVFVGRFIATMTFVKCKGDSFKWYEDVRLFSRETVTNLKPMIKISVLAMLMGIWGWWAFEIFTFMATYLGETEAAAQTQMRSIGLLTFMLPVGYSGASGILTGNAIGASKPKLAITYYKVCMVAALCITVLQMTVLWAAMDAMIRMFTNNEAIKLLLADAWPILIIFTFFDTTQAMGMSVIKASGKQGWGAFITGTAYFMFGIPVSYLCAFKNE